MSRLSKGRPELAYRNDLAESEQEQATPQLHLRSPRKIGLCLRLWQLRDGLPVVRVRGLSDNRTHCMKPLQTTAPSGIGVAPSRVKNLFPLAPT